MKYPEPAFSPLRLPAFVSARSLDSFDLVLSFLVVSMKRQSRVIVTTYRRIILRICFNERIEAEMGFLLVYSFSVLNEVSRVPLSARRLTRHSIKRSKQSGDLTLEIFVRLLAAI